MRSKDGRSREYINTALRAGEDKLLHNPSRGEQVLCWFTVLIALVSLVMSIVTAIMGGDAMTIARAFTEKLVLFLMTVLLTVYDRVFLLRGRSLTVILFCLLSIAGDVFGVVDAGGFAVVLAVLLLLAGAAFYGTLFVDQLSPSDHRLKYRLIYGGALIRLLVILISIIAQGGSLAEAGTAEVLAVMANGLAEIFVMVLMICHFDSGFGYFKYTLNELSTGSETYDAEVNGTDDVAHAKSATPVVDSENDYVPFDKKDETESVIADDDESGYTPMDDNNDTALRESKPMVNTEMVSVEPERPEMNAIEPEPESHSSSSADEVIDDFGYVPYDDDATAAAIDSSVRPLMSIADEHRLEPEHHKEDNDEPLTVIEEDGVLIDDSVIEYEQSWHEPTADADEPEEPQASDRVQQLWAQLTPIEQRYVSFGLAHHKPEDTLQVEGLAGDLFDVWVDNETICFQNDLEQASAGRGVRTAAIPFDAVENIGKCSLDGKDCIVLSYVQDGETVEIGFTSASFGNFRRVMLEAGN